VNVHETAVGAELTLLGPVNAPNGELLVSARNLRAGYSAPPAVFVFQPDGSLKCSHEMDPVFDILAKPGEASDGTIYVPLTVRYPDGQENPGIVALNPDCSEKWLVRLDDPFYLLDNDVLVAGDGSIYLAADTAVGGSLHSAALIALDPSGQIKWNAPIAYVYRLTTPVAGSQGRVYLSLFNPRDDADHPGQMLLFQDQGQQYQVQGVPIGREALPLGPVMAPDGTVLVAVESRYAGTPCSLLVYGADGTLLKTASFDPQFDVQSKPAGGADGSVYIGVSVRIPDAQKQPILLALDKTLGEAWRVSFAPWNVLDNDVAVDPDGAVYLAANNSIGGDGHRPFTFAADPGGQTLWQIAVPYLNYQLATPTVGNVKGVLYNVEFNKNQGLIGEPRFVVYQTTARRNLVK
jgi:cation transport regulator ChaC